ncbi:MAG: DivIVA domain-containing protein [Clostridia bacterium]|nr:MAG: DivIVA domain-containing protein [Clostridia bacterium]
MLTPLDIQNREFSRSFRGYDQKEVDRFLDEIGRGYEELYRENQELRESLQRLEEKLKHYQSLEETLQSTLVVAQQAAEGVKASAAREAEAMLAVARQEMASLQAEDAARHRQALEELEALGKKYQALRARLRAFLVAQLELTEGQEEAAAALEGLEGADPDAGR